MIRPWLTRSKEAAFLFNPAFCCTVISSSIVSYTLENHDGMPFPLVFIVLPIVLHKQTRNLLPFNTRTSLAAWLEKNPIVRIQFYDRAISLKPFVREALIFGFQRNWLTLNSAHIQSTLSNQDVRLFLDREEGEARECMVKSRLVGKWLANAGSPETIMAFWEVKP
jgi:hypothetical protein